MDDMTRRLTELSGPEALRLLGSVSLGRVVFTMNALPTIRPVNHVLDGGEIVFRSHTGAAIVSVLGGKRGAVVAYEADAIDQNDHLGWSVIVTGMARLVTDPAELDRFHRLLRPWVQGEMDQVIRIRPEIVNGFRLSPSPDHRPLSA